MKNLLCLLILSSCALLPDRVYVEAQEREIEDFYDREWLGTIGMEYDLQPMAVVIQGQTTEHPWDLLANLDSGVFQPPEDAAAPTPIYVRDEDIAGLIEAMHETSAQTAADIHALRIALLGTGGGSALLLLLGGGAVWRRRRQPEPEATP